MSREVRHDGASAFQIRFPYDRELVDRIKTLRQRRWNAAERFWWVPEQDVVELVDLLRPADFRFDATTREFYRQFGGTAVLEDRDPAPPGAPRLPGLFDDEEQQTDGVAATAGDQDYTVSRLNREVKQAIEAAFPRAVWLVGEISGFNRSAHKRIVGFKLAEHDDGGKAVSEVSATIFPETRQAIERQLRQVGDPFRLEDEVTVRVRVRVDLYVPWGSYRLVVEELDVNYTLGETARRREEIIRRLTEAKLVGLNTSLEMPALPLRVGLITSLGSDAYNDVLRTLEESGFGFEVTAHGARVQGRATEPSVLNALDRFRARVGRLDVVLICRGGGSRTDLAWFDSERLGRAVARFPLPVLIGIGHEQDHSVLDAVGWRSKTPTAAAGYLVETVARSLETLEALGLGVMERATRRIHDELRLGADRGRRLGLAANGLLKRELVVHGHRQSRLGQAARGRLGAAAQTLSGWLRAIPRAASVHLIRHHGLLQAARRAVVQAARRDLLRESERTEARGRRLHLIDPQRVLERGYAILRLADGALLTRPEMAPAGSAVRAELARGRLRLRSEGGEDEQGGE